MCLCTYVYAHTYTNAYTPSVIDTTEFVMLAWLLYLRVSPSRYNICFWEHSNITVPAEICEQLPSSAKASMLFVLMRCHFSFTSALLQYCSPQAGVLGGQRKKDGFSGGYGSFQIGFWMPRCYLTRNVTCSSIHVCQYISHYSGFAWKFCVYFL